MLCVLCQEREADFDPYLCNECAASLSFSNPDNVRNGYGALFRIGKSFYEGLVEKRITEAQASGLEKPEFISVYSSPTIYFHHARKFLYFSRLFQKIQGIEGDIVECGVEYGLSLFMLCTLAYDEKVHRSVCGIDSFQGPYGLSEKDAHGSMIFAPNAKAITERAQTLRRLLAGLNFYGLPLAWASSNLTLIQGYFHEALSNYTGSQVAFVHIDCNYFDSIKGCLDFFWPKMVRGGIIAFDEYAGSLDLLHFRGAKLAVDEFLVEHNQTIQRDEMYGKYYCVVRK